MQRAAVLAGEDKAGVLPHRRARGSLGLLTFPTGAEGVVALDVGTIEVLLLSDLGAACSVVSAYSEDRTYTSGRTPTDT